MTLQIDVANMILEVADEQQELTRSDFQARADVVARRLSVACSQLALYSRYIDCATGQLFGLNL